MQISKWLAAAGVMVAGTLPVTVRAADNPAQAAARAALMGTMGGLTAPATATNAEAQSIVVTPAGATVEPPSPPAKTTTASPALPPVKTSSAPAPAPAEAPPAPASAGDNPAQAAARAALMEKLSESNPQPAPPANETRVVPTPPPAEPQPAPAPIQAVTPPAPASAGDNPAQAAARAALMEKMAELSAHQPSPPTNKMKAPTPPPMEKTARATPRPPATAVAPVSAPPAKPAVAPAAEPANKSYPGQDLGFKPIEAPPPPVTPEQDAQLHALLMQYEANQITPDQYQAGRAKILAEH